MDRNSKPDWENRVETQIWNLWQQEKMIKQGENAGIWDKKGEGTQV